MVVGVISMNMSKIMMLRCLCKSSRYIPKANLFLGTRVLSAQPSPTSGGPEKKERKEGPFERSMRTPITWVNAIVCFTMCGSIVGYMYYLKLQKEKRREADRKRQLGKTLIGGPWELVNHDGKMMSQKDFLGKWVLIYFGFTHCPDVCPDEIEKMVKVLNKLEEQKKKCDVEIAGLFFTVDPDRDTPQKIKTYITEFSPKLLGFTGSKEQVDKVCKTFRVYYSQGPKDQFADYIVDHTIIVYLIDPNGNFVDYYGQKTAVDEMVSNIQLLDFKYKQEKKAESGQLSFIDRIKMNTIPS